MKRIGKKIICSTCENVIVEDTDELQEERGVCCYVPLTPNADGIPVYCVKCHPKTVIHIFVRDGFYPDLSAHICTKCKNDMISTDKNDGTKSEWFCPRCEDMR